MKKQEYSHKPVLLKEVIEYLDPKDGEIYIDATFGGGGYTKAILDKANCTVIALDRDPDAYDRFLSLKDKYEDRLFFFNINFADLEQVMQEADLEKINGIVFDLGVSSFQLDQAERGFSFMNNGPLDMRMSKEGKSAKDLVNNASEEKLAYIIKEYGDEPKAKRIAKEIAAARYFGDIETTEQLKEIIYKVLGKKTKRIDPATKSFQAIRIWVNNELNSLEAALEKCLTFLDKDARLVTVSFHSGEDKIIKNFINKYSTPIFDPIYNAKIIEPSLLEKVTKKVIEPSEEEVASNPRSRSAKLRCARKSQEV